MTKTRRNTQKTPLKNKKKKQIREKGRERKKIVERKEKEKNNKIIRLMPLLYGWATHLNWHRDKVFPSLRRQNQDHIAFLSYLLLYALCMVFPDVIVYVLTATTFNSSTETWTRNAFFRSEMVKCTTQLMGSTNERINVCVEKR